MNLSDVRVANSGLPRNSSSQMTFYTWRPRPELDEALRAAKDFVAGRYQILTLAGPPGVGKTHLACAIGWELLEQQRVKRLGGLKFCSADSLLDRFRDALSAGRSFREVRKAYETCDCLIIDDLGVERGTVWAMSKLDSLIDHRYRNGLLLVVTTNGKGEDLPPRIADRLRDVRKGKVVQINASSYRIMDKLESLKKED